MHYVGKKAEFHYVTMEFEKLSALNELSRTFCVQCSVLSSVPPRFQDGAFSDYVKICDDG